VGRSVQKNVLETKKLQITIDIPYRIRYIVYVR
jgi:hypothetical protein